MRVKSWLILCILLLAAFVGHAQQAPYFEHIKTDDGLSNNTINCITQDSLGNMWFGTYDGLNRFDGQIITIFKHNSKEPELSIANNKIEELVTDGYGTVWIGLANNLIARFVAGCPDRFVHYDLYEYQLTAYTDMSVGHDGSLVVDFPNFSIRYNVLSDDFEACTHNPDVNEKLQLFKSLFPQADVEKICERRPGEFWLSTRTNGIIIAQQSASGKYETSVVNQQTANPLSLSNNEVYDLYLDKFGVLWVGTKDGGVNRLIESASSLHSISHNAVTSKSLPRGTIRALCEDTWGNLWVGTYSDGVAIYSKKNGIVSHINHSHNNTTNQNWDRVRCIYKTSDKCMWIGSYNGLCRVSPNGSKTYFSSYRGELKHGRIYAMAEDKRSQLWICGWEGLERYNLNTNIIEQVEIPVLKGAHCRTICIASDGNIWIGTEYDGVFIYNQDSQAVTQIKHGTDKGNTLSDNSIFCIVETPDSIFWIATADGLNRYDPVKKTFRHFNRFNGLLSNLVLGIMVDNDRNIWASTSAGVSCVNPQTFFVSNFNRQDGWLNDELTEGAFYKGRDGTIYVGGILGVNFLNPDSLVHDNQAPDIFVLKENSDNELMINFNADELKIGYFDRDSKLQLHAINTFSPQKCVVAWRLSDQKNEWQYSWHSKIEISLSDFSAGDYLLEYKAANNSGVWSAVKRLRIHIDPPIWQNKWMLMLVLIIVLFVVFLFYHLRLRGVQKYNKELASQVDDRTSKIRQQTELLEEQNQKLHASNNDILKQKDRILAQHDHLEELHQKLKDETSAKMNLFTNVSHELRTPLTLIKAPVERLLQAPVSDFNAVDNRKLLETIKEQTDYLLTLVNQTLDYKKIESGKMALHCQTGEIVSFCSDVISLFRDAASELDLELNLVSEVHPIWVKLDFEKLKIVLNNLLSNAIKFTPVNGRIELKVLKINNLLQIEVTDSGIGIPEDCLDFIFDRYYQIGRAVNSIMKGSGIGLALAKEMVLLHGGTIEVISRPGQGSTFLVKLPVESLLFHEIVEKENESMSNIDDRPSVVLSSALPVILLVEDHQKMREYIADLIQSHYFSVLLAENGAEAWRLLKHHKVELILSDWMMPVMDGIELCKKVKSSSKFRHIPFVLFTAKNSNEDQENALECGASDFITKPFSEKALISKINTLIARDKSLLDAYRAQQHIIAVNEIEPTEDEKLLDRMVQAVNLNMANTAFNPDELCEALGLSKMKLYRKCKQLTGFAPIELIRSVRIKRAAQLLSNRGFTISEVSFKVGYNDPKYFSRCFMKEYKMTPSQFQEQNSQFAEASSH